MCKFLIILGRIMAYVRECENLINWYVYGKLPLSEIVFFLTNRCNQRCLTCWQWEDDFAVKGKELTDDKWVELLNQAIELGAHHLYVVGGGEPMVRGDLVLKLGQIAKKKELFCVLHTNGTLFKSEQMDELIQMRWDQVIFSIDGPNPEVNDLIRGEGTFHKAFKNLLYFRDNRVTEKVPTPDLGINFTITKVNYRYIPEMVELAKEAGCGGIHTTLVLPLSEQSKRFALSNEELRDCLFFLQKGIKLSQTYGLYNTFESVIEEIERKLNSNGIVESDFLGERSHSIIDSYCFEPFLSLTISSDGKVGPCCMFWTEENPSVLEKPLKDIWKGDFLEGLRKKLLKWDLPLPCRDCPSQLRKRTSNIKNALVEREKNTSKGIPSLVKKFWLRVRDSGLKSALKRTWEYLYLLFKGL